MDVTIVTCLFDLAQIENSNRRSLKTYLESGKPILDSDLNLVVFGDPDSLVHIRKYREKRLEKTKLIPIYIERLYQGIDQVKDILKEQNIVDPSKNTPYYFALIWAKISFLNSVVNQQPFGNNKVLWIDLGLTHVSNWPSHVSLEELCQTVSLNAEKIHVTLMSTFPRIEFEKNPNKYWTEHSGLFSGALIGGGKEAINWLAQEFWSINRHLLDKKNIVTWEEKILAYMSWKFPQKFQLWFGEYYSIGINWGKIRLFIPRSKYVLFEARSSGSIEDQKIGYQLGIQLINSGLIPKDCVVDIYDDTYICAWYCLSPEERQKECLRLGKDLITIAKKDQIVREAYMKKSEHLERNLSFVGLSFNN